MIVTQELVCADGRQLSIDCYPAKTCRGVTVIAPALGVSKHFYTKFAHYLSEQGHTTILFDYRDTGSNATPVFASGEADRSSHDKTLSHWGRYDIDAVLGYALAHAEQRSVSSAADRRLPVHFVGHSIGGQLLGLAPHSEQLQNIMFVGVSAPHWTRWRFPTNLRMMLAAYALIPALSAVTQQFPVQAMGLGNQQIASDYFQEWARWMRQRDYLFNRRFGLEQQSYQAIRSKILSLGFSDDELAPEANLSELLKFYPNAESLVKMVDASESSAGAIGHVGFFKAKFKDEYWPLAVEFLDG